MSSSLKDTFKTRGYEYPKVTPLYFYNVQLKRSGEALDEAGRVKEFKAHCAAIEDIQAKNKGDFAKILRQPPNITDTLTVLCTAAVAEKLAALTGTVAGVAENVTGRRVENGWKAPQP